MPDKLDVEDAALLVLLVHREDLANTDDLAVQVTLVIQDSPVAHQRFVKSQSKPRASRAQTVLTAERATPDHKETKAPMGQQGNQARMGFLELLVHLDHLAAQDQLDQTVLQEMPVDQVPLHHQSQENPDHREMLDLLDNQATLEDPVQMDPQDSQETRDHQDPPATPEKMEHQETMEPLDPQVLRERREYAPSTALWMVVSSSKMEAVVKERQRRSVKGDGSDAVCQLMWNKECCTYNCRDRTNLFTNENLVQLQFLLLPIFSFTVIALNGK